MRAMVNSLLFVFHFALLLLAATKLTVVTGFWYHQWSCSFYNFSYQHGWGHRFASSFSLLEIALYIGAYGTGLAAFWMLRSRLPLVCGLGIFACLIGLASFGFEATHWLRNHNYSLIASAPVLMVFLWICLVVQLVRVRWRLRATGAISRVSLPQ
jgi:hypothetical protein